MMNLKGRNFLKLMDYTPEEILYLIDLAADLKKKKKEGTSSYFSVIFLNCFSSIIFKLLGSFLILGMLCSDSLRQQSTE